MRAKLVYESLKDVLKPKSEKEVEKALKKNIDGDMLVKCAEIDLIRGVKMALDKGIDIHYNDDLPLRAACRYGRLKIVKLLLDKGADPSSTNNDALHWATSRGDLEIVKLLLDKGANINDYALKVARDGAHKDVVDFLEKYKVNESIKDVLRPKTDDEIQSGIKNMSLEDYDYEMVKAFAPYNEFNRITKHPKLRRLVRKMALQGFKNKINPKILAKEIADKCESKMNESLKDVLKPKDSLKIKSDLKSILGIDDDVISIKIWHPKILSSPQSPHNTTTLHIAKRNNIELDKYDRVYYKATGNLENIWKFVDELDKFPNELIMTYIKSSLIK